MATNHPDANGLPHLTPITRIEPKEMLPMLEGERSASDAAYGRAHLHHRLARAKRAFVTRRLSLAEVVDLTDRNYLPQPGDVLLARITTLGQHKRIELETGRRSALYVGDEIIVVYGNRYAPDQFHALVPANFGPCSLVAGGGIAAAVVDKHAKMGAATTVEPIGMLAKADGSILNVRDGGLPSAIANKRLFRSTNEPHIIAIVGSSMNAGKTTTAAHICVSLRGAGLKVAACKVTGTGSGGDMWSLGDAGAYPVLDFTDAGFATTYKTSAGDVERIVTTLLSHLGAARPDVIVIEVADGLYQEETRRLVQSPLFRRHVDGVLYACADAAGACAGIDLLRKWGYEPLALSGTVSASPLATAEAIAATGLDVITLERFLNDSTVPTLLLQGSGRVAGVQHG
jgi:hypothetical protein